MNASRSPATAASQLVDFTVKFGIQKLLSKMARQKTTQTQAEAGKKVKGEESRKTLLYQNAPPPSAGAQEHKRPRDKVTHLTEN